MKERGCIILAAGRGRRLNLEDMPKVMAGLYDKPIIHHTIETLLKTNPDEIVIVVGHKAETIIKYFGNSFKYCVQEILNGNAGALKVGLEGLDPAIRNVLVLQGDDSAFYSPDTLFQIFAVHDRTNADITVLLTDDFDERTHRSQFVVNNDGHILSYQRKITNPRDGAFFTGTCCFKRDFLLAFLPRLTPDSTTRELVIPQLFQLALSYSRKIYGVHAPKGEWVGINTPQELARAQQLMSQRHE